MSAQPIPSEADGLTATEAATMKLLSRAGLVPGAAAFKAGDAECLRAPVPAAPARQTALSAHEIETTELLARAGFLPGAHRGHLPSEADGLTNDEAATMALLANAGFVPSATPRAPVEQKGFHR